MLHAKLDRLEKRTFQIGEIIKKKTLSPTMKIDRRFQHSLYTTGYKDTAPKTLEKKTKLIRIENDLSTKKNKTVHS